MNEYLWVLNKEGKWEKLTNPTEIQINKCLQEISLWVGENPIDIYQGIDYKGIRDRRVFLKKSIDDVVENYRPLFDSIEVGDPVQNNDIISIDIIFTKNQQNQSFTMDFKG